jgi:hypothetical protein
MPVIHQERTLDTASIKSAFSVTSRISKNLYQSIFEWADVRDPAQFKPVVFKRKMYFANTNTNVNYFFNKEAIVLAALRKIQSTMNHSFDALLEANAHPIDVIERMFHETVAWIAEQPEVFCNLLKVLPRSKNALSQIYFRQMHLNYEQRIKKLLCLAQSEKFLATKEDIKNFSDLYFQMLTVLARHAVVTSFSVLQFRRDACLLFILFRKELQPLESKVLG